MARHNQAIHQLFVRQQWTECGRLIERAREESGGQAEYALLAKALIARQQGDLAGSLALFQQAASLNTGSLLAVKQVARGLLLLGKHGAAAEVYDEALRVHAGDWELWHGRGLAAAAGKDEQKALESFQSAVSIQPHDSSFMQMGELHAARGDLEAALHVYMEALRHSPDSPELLTTLGVTFLKLGDLQRAFEHLGTSLLHDPRNVRTILAAGSVMQDHQDADVALLKYRTAATVCPASPLLWSNIGMCFFTKQRYIAAIACLKRAQCLGPFEWLVAHNLGLVYLSCGQPASAFQHLSTAVNLNAASAHSYALLAQALSALDDPDNAAAAYAKAMSLEPREPAFRVNAAVTAFNAQRYGHAREHLDIARALLDEATAPGDDAMDAELRERTRQLALALEPGRAAEAAT